MRRLPPYAPPGLSTSRSSPLRPSLQSSIYYGVSLEEEEEQVADSTIANGRMGALVAPMPLPVRTRRQPQPQTHAPAERWNPEAALAHCAAAVPHSRKRRCRCASPGRRGRRPTTSSTTLPAVTSLATIRSEAALRPFFISFFFLALLAVPLSLVPL